MNETIHTLHDFYLYTKGFTYILMVLALVGITGFWCFLTARDDE